MEFNHVNPNNKKRRQKLYTKGTNIKKSLNELRNDHRLEKKKQEDDYVRSFLKLSLIHECVVI